MVRSRHIALVVGAVLMAGVGLPAAAVTPVGTTQPTPIARGQGLSAAHPLLAFAGQMHNPAPIPMASDPDPTVCAVDCQLWSLRVATNSPFLVSLHNTTSSIDDGFNLYVYDPAGRLPPRPASGPTGRRRPSSRPAPASTRSRSR